MASFRGKNATNDKVAGSAKWKSLELIMTSVDDEGMISIVSKSQKLEEIAIMGGRISSRGVAAICTLPHLVSLWLAKLPHLGDECIDSVANVQQLRELSLEFTGVTDKGMEGLGRLEHLRTISLAGSKISDRGIKSLTSCSRLSIIDFSFTRILGRTLSALPRVGRENIYLDNSDICNSGIIEFSVAHPETERISLNNTNVDDEIMPTLSRLEGLCELRLESTQITDAGVIAMAGHKSLRMIYLGGTSVSDDTVRLLKEQAPMPLTVYTTVSESRFPP